MFRPSIPDDLTLERELRMWQEERNREQAQVHWRFSTQDAHIKLHHLYP